MQLTRDDRTFLAALGSSTLWIAAGYFVSGWLQRHSFTRMVYLALPPAAAVAVILVCKGGILKEFIRAWCKALCAFVLAVSACAVLVLLACSAVGYLPYSDRPGPGWGNIPPHFPGLDELKYFSGWALLLVPMCYFTGSILFIFMAWIRWLNAPPWLARSLGGVFSAGFGIVAIAAAGWYISIAPVVANIVGVVCLLFGIFVLPRVSPSRLAPLSLPFRIAGIAFCFLGRAWTLIYPFLR
jgi:hypothetical protein